MHAKKHIKETYFVCGAVLKGGDQPIDSFAENDLFIFTPQEFIDRLEYIAKQTYPDFQYTYESINIGLDEDALFACVALGKMCVINLEAGIFLYPIDTDVSELFYHACDPKVSEDDLLSKQMMHLCTFVNWIDSNELVGYSEMNSVNYAFTYALKKTENHIIDIQSIQACAFN